MTRSSETTISVHRETMLLDRSGAAFVPGEATLVFADLHFEKGSAFARRGAFLPPYDTRSTIRRMTEAIARFSPARIVALGDSFHDGEAAGRLGDDDCAALKRLTKTCEWIWVEGNHDPKPPDWLGGTVASEIALGGLVLRHLPRACEAPGEVAGHLHPSTVVARRGLSVRRRCFASDGRRLLLPAFGAYTGGLDVRDEAVAALFPEGCSIYALGRERVYAVQLKRRKTADASHPNKTARNTVATP
jgi:hypothetical protein